MDDKFDKLIQEEEVEQLIKAEQKKSSMESLKMDKWSDQPEDNKISEDILKQQEEANKALPRKFNSP